MFHSSPVKRNPSSVAVFVLTGILLLYLKILYDATISVPVYVIFISIISLLENRDWGNAGNCLIIIFQWLWWNYLVYSLIGTDPNVAVPVTLSRLLIDCRWVLTRSVLSVTTITKLHSNNVTLVQMSCVLCSQMSVSLCVVTSVGSLLEKRNVLHFPQNTSFKGNTVHYSYSKVIK